MNSLNSILLEGNLIADPVLKHTPNGTSFCEFSLAYNRFVQNGENTEKEVSYFEVEAWSGLGKACAKELKKGHGVRIVGRLKQDRWTDESGEEQSHVKIVVEHVEYKPKFSVKDDKPF